MDATAAQLRSAKGVFPPKGRGVHASDAGAGPGEPGSGNWRLAAEDAEEPGPNECAGASRRLGPRRSHWNGHPASDREGRTKPPEIGPTTGSPVQEKRKGDR